MSTKTMSRTTLRRCPPRSLPDLPALNIANHKAEPANPQKMSLNIDLNHFNPQHVDFFLSIATKLQLKAKAKDPYGTE